MTFQLPLKHPALEQLRKALTSFDKPLLFEELWDAPKALLIYLAAKTQNRPILVIAKESEENRLIDDLNFLSNLPLYEFPSWETFPGEQIPPSADLVGRRFEILHTIKNKKSPFILLAPLQAVLQKLPALDTLLPACTHWKTGDEIPFELVEEYFTSLGYHRRPIAADKGEFALRGGILDIFPIGSTDPYRFDFFGDTIERIRTYDPVSQKSTATVQKLFLSPADEPELLAKSSNLSTLFDYFHTPPIIFFDNLIAFEDRAITIAEQPSFNSKFFITPAQFFHLISKNPQILTVDDPLDQITKTSSLEILGHTFNFRHLAHPFIRLPNFFESDPLFDGIPHYPELNLQLICTNDTDQKTLDRTLSHIQLPKETHYHRGYLSSGLAIHNPPYALFPSTELTKRYQVRRNKWRSSYHTPASEFHEILPGDLVVHFHNGIGKFIGMERKEGTEYFVIEYANNSKLFTPISQAHLISRYIGAKEETPTLSALGSNKWQRTKNQAQQAITGYAEQLLKFNAERAIQGGFAFDPDSPEFLNFESDFPFIESEDQQRAITDVKADMTASKSMDRLICGDAGYGKTEVAMRAAAKAVLDGGKQVVILAPTTVLAIQHYETFTSRMADYPVNIRLLCRMTKPKQVKQTLLDTASNTVDILIGTHRLLSKDVHIPNLGLIVIDEEQRFGVRAKEQLKQIQAGVDCLYLSATPIPRTLYLSLVGAREVSIINTPPQDRLPIKSVIAARSPDLVKNAILRELSRDGQIYFIHNRVDTLGHNATQLKHLIPNIRIAIAHGQMPPEQIDQAFHDFKTHKVDLLLATTIVENGLDIPNANTILVDRADTYGLAALYQLRGRVGRWNRPAFCYFLTPANRSLPEITEKRLRALSETSGHGGGMKVAMRDLEIRGAGDILGLKQSGHIASIGFHLYCKLLKRTVDALQKKIPPHFTETKIEHTFDARLPEDYINETSLRLEIYHRLGEITTLSETETLLSELQDRFGPPPPPALWLYHLNRIRILASHHQYSLIKFFPKTLLTKRFNAQSSIPLPHFTSPQDLEEFVTSKMK